MFDSFTTDESKALLMFLFVCLLITRMGGFAFLFQIILRVLRVDFRSEKLKKYNDNAFDTQIYRLLNGINVACVDDAKLIEENIESGRLRRTSFWFTGFFGPMGHKKIIGFDFILVSFVFTLSVIHGITLLTNTILNYKIGYATFNLKHERLYISTDEIYNKNAEIIIDKKHCSQYKYALSNIYDEACDYITPTSKEKSNALIDAIENERKNAITSLLIGLSFLCMAITLLLGFITFNSLNKEICNIKDNVANSVT
ncbi:hypothetical protein [Serratia sp. D1N4]